jgi:antibiotic biosynthesis monooxygenase (ABM) superfamily enzyme
MPKPNQTEELFVYTFHNDLTREQIPDFQVLQAKLDAAAQSFEGYLGQELTFENNETGIHCTARIQFRSLEQCLEWLDSRIRRQLLSEAAVSMGYQYRSGIDSKSFEQWISSKSAQSAPTWKINLLVWLALYPSVMLLTLAGQSTLGKLPLPLNMLIGNAITVAVTGWCLVPWLSRIYQPWLEERSRRWQVMGTLSIFGLLLLSLTLFSQLPGMPWRQS